MIRVIALLLLLPAIAIGAPSITSYSGTVSDGNSITISGSDFGTKTTVAPLVFEDFDTNDTGRQDGDTLRGESCSDYGTWIDDANDTTPTFEADDVRTGSTLSSYHPLDCNNTSANHAPSTITFSDSHKPTVLISYWLRMDWANMSGSGNIKIMRMRIAEDSWTYEGDTSTSLRMGAHGDLTDAYFTMYMESGGADWPGEAVGPTTLNFTLSQATWQHYILMFSASDDDTANGTATIWQDGNLLIDTDVMETWDDSDEWERLTFGWYCALYTGGDVDIKYDDIYVDDTWQSVWIGNDSTWASCSHREVQIPTSWSTTSITATVNQGSFSDGTAYLFVIDENGDPSSGYEITLGASSTPTFTGIISTGVDMK